MKCPVHHEHSLLKGYCEKCLGIWVGLPNRPKLKRGPIAIFKGKQFSTPCKLDKHHNDWRIPPKSRMRNEIISVEEYVFRQRGM